MTVLTKACEKRGEWHNTIARAVAREQSAKMRAETEFVRPLLALPDRKTGGLSAANLYAAIVKAILQKLLGGDTDLK